jgi:hypothetical protein
MLRRRFLQDLFAFGDFLFLEAFGDLFLEAFGDFLFLYDLFRFGEHADTVHPRGLQSLAH